MIKFKEQKINILNYLIEDFSKAVNKDEVIIFLGHNFIQDDSINIETLFKPITNNSSIEINNFLNLIEQKIKYCNGKELLNKQQKQEIKENISKLKSKYNEFVIPKLLNEIINEV